MKNICVFSLALLLVFSLAFAHYPGWINYTPGAYVSSLLGDGEVMWVGNIGGLVCIDHVTGEQTFYNKANAGLPDNFITCMATDKQGHKWVGTYFEGIFEFDGSTVCAVYNRDNSPLLENHISAVAIDESDRIWIGMAEKGLAVLDSEAWTVFTYQDSYLFPSGVGYLSIDNRGTLWAGLYATPVHFDGQEWVAHYFDHPVWAVAPDNNNNMWAFIDKEGLGEYDGSEWTIYPVPDSLSGEQVLSLVVDESGTKWMSTWGKGLLSFDGITWTQYRTNNSDIPSDTLMRVAVDADGCIWAGTTEKGVGRFDGKEWTLFSASNSKLPVEDITAIESDENHNHWIGTNGGGLICFDEQDWEVYTRSNSSLPSDSIQSLYFDSDNNLWVGTYTRGVAKFDGSTWALYDTSNSDLPTNDIRDIAADSNGSIWVITWNWLISFDGQVWNRYQPENFSEFGSSFYALNIDRQDIKWIGFWDAGLACFNGNNWTNYNTENSGLPDNGIRGIAIDSQDHKWITTRGGMAEFDGNTWTVFTSDNSGLPYKWVTEIAIDQFDRKWFGIISRGVACFDGAEWQQFAGPQSPLSGFLVNAIDIDFDNKVWIGGDAGVSAGLTVYDEDQIQGVEPVITSFPDKLYLEQNYPNPFNAQTEIRYALQQTGPVSLKVFDIVGREVATLVQEVQNAGSYNITFDGAGVPSGIYFYQLQFGAEYRVKKMLLLR